MNSAVSHPDENTDNAAQGGDAEGQASTAAADETKPADTESGASER